ncbi:MAG: hypothetical protein IJB62_04635 [Alistipes sp.]|nr:hypothetical protein [Alistipes sp.]
MSIRLTGGHSFSVATPTQKVDEVELLTSRTLLVPEQFYAAEGAKSAFAASGMPIEADDQVLPIRTDKGMMALVALTSAEQEALSAAFGDEVRYTTPLLHPVGNIEPTVWICDTEDLIYIKVYDPKLQAAEVVAIENEADREYLLSRLIEACDPKRYTVRLNLRSKNKQLLRHYKNLFKRLQCE